MNINISMGKDCVGNMVRHIVFWKIKDDERKQNNLEKMREKLLSLTDKINGIISAEVGFNFSSSDYDIIFDVIFEDPFALKQYQSHPENIKLRKFAESILVDCVASDYMIDPADSVRKKESGSGMKMTSTSMPNSQERAPIARVNKNSNRQMNDNMMNGNYGNNYDNNNYNNNYDNNYDEMLQGVRNTLAMPINNMDDSAFELPDDGNNYPYDNDDAFDLPPNRRSREQMQNNNMSLKNARQKRNTGKFANTGNFGNNQGMRNTSGQLPFADNNSPDNMQMNNESWKCPKCGKINAGFSNMCTCGRRKPVMSNAAMNANKNLIQKPQNSMLINSGVLPNLNETQNMKMTNGGLTNTGIIPVASMQQRDVEGWRCPQCGSMNSSFDSMCSCGLRQPLSKGKRPSNPPMKSRQNQYDNGPDMNQQGKRRPSNMNNTGRHPKITNPDMFGADNDMMMQQEPNNYRSEKPNREREWTCPNCGKVNRDIVGLCGCGQKKLPSFNSNNRGQGMPPRGGNQTQGMPRGGKGQNKPMPRGGKGNMNQGGGPLHSLNDAINNFKSKGMNQNMNNMQDDRDFYGEDEFDAPMMNNGPGQPNGFMDENDFGGGDVDSWKCPRCGKINGNFVGRCGCGQRKPARGMNRRDY